MPETLSPFHATGHDGESRGAGSGRSPFFARVFGLVSRIPHGRVTTYGAIAHALGTPRAARSVGWALSLAPDEDALPCHRVVDRNGFLSGGWHWGHPDVMAGLLSDEGVPFLETYRVDLAACLWLPDEEDPDLPSDVSAAGNHTATARSSPD
jgi:methylated-DNA-protein-cysteine methyltransferase related protein